MRDLLLAFAVPLGVSLVMTRVMRGAATPTALMVAPGIKGFVADMNKRLPYDPENAKKLLAEAAALPAEVRAVAEGLAPAGLLGRGLLALEGRRDLTYALRGKLYLGGMRSISFKQSGDLGGDKGSR